MRRTRASAHSRAAKARWADPITGAKLRAALGDPDTRAKMREATNARWADPLTLRLALGNDRNGAVVLSVGRNGCFWAVSGRYRVSPPIQISALGAIEPAHRAVGPGEEARAVAARSDRPPHCGPVMPQVMTQPTLLLEIVR
jgi:hypothetical protein